METLKKAVTKQEQIEAKAEAFDLLHAINFIVGKLRANQQGDLQVLKEGQRGTPVERAEFPPDGGVLTYFEGLKYPQKGFPFGATVEHIDRVKKNVKPFLKWFTKILGQNKLRTLLFFLIFRRELEELFKSLVVSFYSGMHIYLQNPMMYCRSVRELYKASTLMILCESDKEWKQYLEFMRDLACMFMEYDDTYRYRWQFVLSKLNKDNLKKDVIKELNRLLDIAIEKETYEGVYTKWQDAKKLLFFLRFSPKFKLKLQRFFLEINLEEIKMDEGDEYHACIKYGFDFGLPKHQDYEKAVEKYQEQKEEVSK